MSNTDSLSLSNSFSKETKFEKSDFSSVYFEDLRNRDTDSISTEVLEKNNTVLNTYTITSDAISGGMGSVWRVHHQSWNTDLAMKRPQPRFFAEGGDEKKAQFVDECEHWINLGLHPNIVSCYYVREIGGVPTIFSEWMDGGSLSDRIKDGSLYEGTETETQERILDIAIQAARGLQYSHENGLIHQDFKPGNLLLTKEWDAKVADFGLAKAKSNLGDKSDTAKTTGYTLAYCPQEQVDREEPQKWMDVYSWALTVLEMYAGKRLWQTGAEAKEHFEEYPEKCAHTVPDEMQKLLKDCLTDKPDGFIVISDKLNRIYSSVTGNDYPRAASGAAADTADSLNNKALSFLDIGMQRIAMELWNKALEDDPNCIDALFNQQLYMLRNNQINSDDVINRLQLNVAAKEAGLVEEIRREYPIPSVQSDFINAKTNGRIRGYFENLHANVITEDELVLYSRHRTYYMICRFRFCRDDTRPLYDTLDKNPEIKKRIVSCALCRNGKQAILLFNDDSFCLYDIGEKRIDKDSSPFPEFKNKYCNLMTLSPNERYMAVYSEYSDEKTVFLMKIPEFTLVCEQTMNLIGFTADDRCLFRGKVSGMKEALFLIDADGNPEEVFRFERMLDRSFEYESNGSLFLAYVYKRTEEAFYLDKSFRKKPIDINILNQINRVVFYDADRSLLCTVDKKGRASFWSISSQRLLFTLSSTFDSPRKRMALYYKKEDKLLFWKYEGNSKWESVDLSQIPMQNKMAQWRLSVIETSQGRLEEEKRKSELIMQFEEYRKQSNIPRMIAIHREYTERIDNEAQALETWEMENSLDVVAVKERIRAVRFAGKSAILPPCNSSYDVEICGDDLVACWRVSDPSIGVCFYRRNGTFIRKVRLPDSASYVCVRGERILVFGKDLDITEYSLDGDNNGVLLNAVPQAEELREQEIKQNEEDRRSLFLHAVDVKGENMVYSIVATPLGSYQYSSRMRIYLRNLKTGKTFMLDDFWGKTNHIYSCFNDSVHIQIDFLFDGSIIMTPLPIDIGFSSQSFEVKKEKEIFRRISPEDGKTLTEYRKALTDYNSDHRVNRFILNPERTLIFCHADIGLPDLSYLYRADGTILGMWKPYTSDVFFLPGERYMVYRGQKDDTIKKSFNGISIWDVEEKKDCFTQSFSGQGYEDFVISPNGREIYSTDRVDNQTRIYHIEYDYRLPERIDTKNDIPPENESQDKDRIIVKESELITKEKPNKKRGFFSKLFGKK